MVNEVISLLIDPYDLVRAIGVTALIMIIGYGIAKFIRQKNMGSAISIIIGLVLAYIAGKYTGGSKGLSDIPFFSGMGLLGGSMLRDYTIVATAYGVKAEYLKKAGLPGIVSIFVGIFSSFIIGVCIAFAMGYRTSVDLTTIGAGTVTFIVGPVTGGALGASSDVIALAIAAGVVKSVLCIILTPITAKRIGLDNPVSAMVYGGLIGTTSGVAGWLAATDPKLMPYGAMTATFYTGLGCLLCPSVCFLIVRIIFG